MARRDRFQDFPLGPRSQGQPLHRWLYEELRQAILEGRLTPGVRLPSSRNLSRQQGISRATVVAVFEQLIAEGYLVGRVGAGTVVAPALPERFTTAGAAARPPPAGAAKRSVTSSTGGSTGPRPVVLAPPRPFEIYCPGIDCFPVQTWRQLAARRLRLGGTSLLQAGDPRGHRPLREAVAAYLRSARSVRCEPEQVMIVSGTQQALDFVARLTLARGDAVCVEDPGYPGATRVFAEHGARVIPIPVDAAGLRIDQAIRRAAASKLIYVTPAHQFPLGATLPLERRLALLAWAERKQAWIFEDDYDGEYRYDVRPIGALQGHDRTGRVIYAGSFNKLLFPALRLGYVVLPPALVDRFLALRDTIDRYPPTLEQAVLADFMGEGHFERHIRRSRSLYRERRDTLLAAAAQHLTGLLELAPADAGFYVLGRLPDGVRDTELQIRGQACGLELMPLSSFYQQQPAGNGLLLGFAAVKPGAIKRSVVRLAGLLAERRRGDSP